MAPLCVTGVTAEVTLNPSGSGRVDAMFLSKFVKELDGLAVVEMLEHGRSGAWLADASVVTVSHAFRISRAAPGTSL